MIKKLMSVLKWMNRVVFIFQIPLFVLSPLIIFGSILSEDKFKGFLHILLALFSSIIMVFSYKVEKNLKKSALLEAFQNVKRILLLVAVLNALFIVIYVSSGGIPYFLSPSLIMTWHYLLWFVVQKRSNYTNED